jgi:predicted ATPase
MLDATNAADVVAICRKLEGVPLAIEIAASRITLMGAASDSGTPGCAASSRWWHVIPAGRRAQQALRGAVEWSYNLLGEVARALFAQLSVVRRRLLPRVRTRRRLP